MCVCVCVFDSIAAYESEEALLVDVAASIAIRSKPDLRCTYSVPATRQRGETTAAPATAAPAPSPSP